MYSEKYMEFNLEKQMDLEVIEVMEQRLNNPKAEYDDTDEFFESLGLEKDVS